MIPPLPPLAGQAIGALESAGHEAFAVGGCVRDLLLGIPPADIDIATSALPEQVARAFSGHRILPTGLRHGTVTVRLEEGSVEITTYRIDGGYTDGRRPDSVTFTPRLRDDLARRDFTVNAMALGKSGLVDPFGGERDLRARLLRPVGDGRLRFSEDALRILRAFRFMAQLDFTIPPETQAALAECAPLLCRVSAERIGAELSKLLSAASPTSALRLMQSLSVLPELLPRGDFPLLEDAPPDLALRLALLLSGFSPTEAHSRLASFRLPGALLSRVERFLSSPEFSPSPASREAVKRLLGHFGPADFLLFCEFRARCAPLQAGAWRDAARLGGEIQANGECWSLTQLAIGGDELCALGFSGPAVGKALNALLDAVIADALPNERASLLTYAAELTNKAAFDILKKE